MQIIRGYDYQVDVAIWAHKHSYDRMWPVYTKSLYVKSRGEVSLAEQDTIENVSTAYFSQKLKKNETFFL